MWAWNSACRNTTALCVADLVALLMSTAKAWSRIVTERNPPHKMHMCCQSNIPLLLLMRGQRLVC